MDRSARSPAARSCCSPPPAAHPADARAPVGRLVDPSPSLAAGVVTYAEPVQVPTPEATPADRAVPADHAGHTMPAGHAGHTMPADHAGHTMPADHTGHTMPADHAGHAMPAADTTPAAKPAEPAHHHP